MGVKQWTDKKRDYIMALSPKKLIIVMDGDNAGVRATGTLYKELSKVASVDFVKVKNYGVDVDLGEAPPKLLREIRSLL